MMVVPPAPQPPKPPDKIEPEQKATEQAAGATEPATGEPAGVADVGRLAVRVQRDGRLAVYTRSLQILRWRGRLATLHNRPYPVHRVSALGDNPSDPNQVHWTVGVIQCSLRRPVPADRSVEVVAGVGMQLDLRFKPHHVVGEHRDLRPEQRSIGLLRPRPFGSLRSTSPAPPPHQQPHCTGTPDEHHWEHPAGAIVVTAVTGSSGLSGRTRSVTHTLNKTVEHCGGAIAVGFERCRRQLGGHAGSQLATPGAEAVADNDTERAGSTNGVGQLAGHLRRVTTGEIGRRRRQHSNVDRRVSAADDRPQLLDLVIGQCPLGIRIDVHRVATKQRRLPRRGPRSPRRPGEATPTAEPLSPPARHDHTAS